MAFSWICAPQYVLMRVTEEGLSAKVGRDDGSRRGERVLRFTQDDKFISVLEFGVSLNKL